MATYKEHQQRFAAAILAEHNLTSSPAPLFAGLIDSLPYYRDPRFDAAHRGALANLLEINLPNDSISAEPTKSGFGWSDVYTYTGSYSGYRDAFFHGMTASAPAAAVASQVISVNSSLQGPWWGEYGLAAVTDAIRTKVTVTLDTGSLSGALSSYHQTFVPALSASVLAIMKKGFAPTENALAAIAAANQTTAVCTSLISAIEKQQFTANINQALSAGGDGSYAAVWFLYQLWITLKALGAPNVDALITQFKGTGLDVPSQVGPGNFWKGDYANWYTPLAGADVLPQASPAIDAAMPERVRYNDATGPQLPDKNVTAANGYAYSLATWGSLSRYVPGAASCFGAGTGVLMADGSVKPIEQVRLGDVVLSSLGPKRVVLIETPQRNGRPLYRLNDLDLRVTMAHPFRTVPGGGPARVAVDAWALLDHVPSTIGGGAGTLGPGVKLAGRDQAGASDIAVSTVTTCSAENLANELVYDLLLEAWEKGQASYYVGGPSAFVAADAETVDPLYDIALTMAVISAMEESLAACREHVADPVHELSAQVARIPLANAARAALSAAPLAADDSSLLRAIPPPEFYMKDGAWDPHASALESHIVRHLSRRLRREIKTGWRSRSGTSSAADRFVVVLHDIELIGEAGLPAGTVSEVELRLQHVAAADDVVRRIAVAASDKRRWHIVIDEIVDFERIDFKGQPAALIGTVLVGGEPAGSCRVFVSPTGRMSGEDTSEEHFVFDANGRVVGRLALHQRKMSLAELDEEKQRAAGWRRKQNLTMAGELGRKMGQELAARVARKKARGA